MVALRKQKCFLKATLFYLGQPDASCLSSDLSSEESCIQRWVRDYRKNLGLNVFIVVGPSLMILCNHVLFL